MQKDQTEIDDLKNVLAEGKFFIKHHRFSSPKLRFIWLDPSNNTICWGLSEVVKNETVKKKKGSIFIKDIIALKRGLEKSKSLPKNNKDLRTPCIFSIISDKRTLELEAPNKELMEEWINALHILLSQQKNSIKGDDKSVYMDLSMSVTE